MEPNAHPLRLTRPPGQTNRKEPTVFCHMLDVDFVSEPNFSVFIHFANFEFVGTKGAK